MKIVCQWLSMYVIMLNLTYKWCDEDHLQPFEPGFAHPHTTRNPHATETLPKECILHLLPPLICKIPNEARSLGTMQLNRLRHKGDCPDFLDVLRWKSCVLLSARLTTQWLSSQTPKCAFPSEKLREKFEDGSAGQQKSKGKKAQVLWELWSNRSDGLDRSGRSDNGDNRDNSRQVGR